MIPESTYPAIAVDPLDGGWFVSWRAEVIGPTPPWNFEVVGGLFDAAGAPAEPDAFLVGFMDPSLEPVPGGGRPAIAQNTDFGSRLITWSGDLAATPGDEHEIFTQAWNGGGPGNVTDVPGTTWVFAPAIRWRSASAASR